MEKQRVLLACDHGGLQLKNHLVNFLKKKHLNVVDLGVHTKESVSYPDFSKKMVDEIKENDKGIVICGTGLGISYGVIKGGIKCSLAFNEQTAKECRRENYQVMGMGNRVITQNIGQRMTLEFLGLKE